MQPSPDDAPKRHLPFAWFWPLLVGAGVSLLLRIAFSGGPGGAYSAMLGSFIYLAPVLCGAVTVFMAERTRRRSWHYYVWAPWLSTLLMVAGSLMIFIEGLICAIVILPLFGILGSVGGVLMGIVCRLTQRAKPVLYSFAALPLVLGAIEPQFPNPERLSSTTRSVFIAATPAQVWQALNDVRDIRGEELGDVWAYRIGVPQPAESITEATAEGHVRHMRWRKNVRFDGLITTWEPGRELAWRYRFTPESVPPGVLDDHVIIGGHYFDLRQTRFTLTPREGGTELRIEVAWRVNTRFNWYADRVAQFLLGDFSENILRFYKARSEALA